MVVCCASKVEPEPQPLKADSESVWQSVAGSREADLYRFKPKEFGHGRNSRGQKVADQSSPANSRAHPGRRRVAGAQRPAPSQALALYDSRSESTGSGQIGHLFRKAFVASALLQST